MLFNKKNQQEQAEAMPIASMSASSGRQSLFAPGLNPTPAYIDFGLEQAYAPQPTPPATVTPEPLPECTPETPSDTPQQSWTDHIQPEAAAMPMPNADTFTEPAYPTPETNPMQEPFPPSWEEPQQPIPAATQPYLTETFENYTTQPTNEPIAPELTAWEAPPEMAFSEPPSQTTFEPFEPALVDALQTDNAQTQWDAPETNLPMEDFAAFSANTMIPEPTLMQAQPEPLAFPNEAPFMPDISSTEPTDLSAWSNELPEVESSHESPIPLEPGAFLDSVNQQLYPQDPFSSVNSELDEGAQAFEEAAQFLFPETMGAPLDWSVEDTGAAFDDTPMLVGETAFEPILELGPSFQSETAGFDDISAFETSSNQYEQFSSPSMSLSAAGLNFSTPPEEPDWGSDNQAFSFSSDAELAAGLPSPLADETIYTLDTALGTNSLAGTSATAEAAFEFGTSAEGTPEREPSSPSYEPPAQWNDASLPSPQIPEPGSIWTPEDSSDTYMAPPEIDTPMNQALQPTIGPDEDFYAVSFTLDEQGELVPDHGEPTIESMNTALSSALPTPEYYSPAEPQAPQAMPDDTFPKSTSIVEGIPLFYSEESFEQPQPPMPEPVPVSEASLSAFEFLNEPAESVATFEENVSMYSFDMPTSATELSFLPDILSEEAAPPTHYLSMPESALLPPSQETQPIEQQPAVSPAAPQHQSPLPETTQPTAATIGAVGTTQTAFKPQTPQTPASPPETQWEHPQQLESQPVPQKPAQPPTSDSILSGDVEILSICPLDHEKRLLLIHNGGVFALMGQCGAEQPNISVLKVFENNPIAYQNTFTAVAEGQTGNQGMYVVQVGTWHAIISTFQNNVTLHTELG